MWAKFVLKKKPFFYADGTQIVDYENAPNRLGIHGGGKEGYPDISKGKTVERHEKGVDLLINANVTSEEISTMKGSVITEEEANQIKKDTFKIESGVKP